MTKPSPHALDALLPQTQCGLCGFGACLPYAQAMVYENAPPNLCPPGGVKTLRALGEKLDCDTQMYVEDMFAKQKPAALAVIRESECIGCTKCIQACPVDAIIGFAKQMHTILTDWCTGCELCIPPCPVDCIDLLITPEPEIRMAEQKANLSRERYQARQKRLATPKKTKNDTQKIDKQKYIQEALARYKNKKNYLTNKNQPKKLG